MRSCLFGDVGFPGRWLGQSEAVGARYSGIAGGLVIERSTNAHRAPSKETTRGWPSIGQTQRAQGDQSHQHLDHRLQPLKMKGSVCCLTLQPVVQAHWARRAWRGAGWERTCLCWAPGRHPRLFSLVHEHFTLCSDPTVSLLLLPSLFQGWNCACGCPHLPNHCLDRRL